MKYDKKQIMLVAHRLHRETDMPFGDCLKQAWSMAKAPKAVAIPPQRLPLEAVVISAYNLARKIRGSRIEVAAKIHVDLGLRVTPKNENPLAYVSSKNLSIGYERRPN